MHAILHLNIETVCLLHHPLYLFLLPFSAVLLTDAMQKIRAGMMNNTTCYSFNKMKKSIVLGEILDVRYSYAFLLVYVEV